MQDVMQMNIHRKTQEAVKNTSKNVEYQYDLEN